MHVLLGSRCGNKRNYSCKLSRTLLYQSLVDIRSAEDKSDKPGKPTSIDRVSSCIQRSSLARLGSMAEAVGLAASIVALAGLAHTVLNFVGETQNIVRGMGNLGKETGRSMHHIYFAAGTIDTAQSTLSRYCAAGGIASQSQVIQFIEDKGTAAFLESESKYLGQHVDKLREGVYALEKRWAPVATILWRYFIKGQVEDLRDDMQFIQVDLGVLLSCVQLEKALNRRDRDEAEMQVKFFPRVYDDKVTDHSRPANIINESSNKKRRRSGG